MKKLLLVSFLSLLSAISSVAQTQLENPGFEDWQNASAPEAEPTQYSSLKTADLLAGSAPQVVWGETTIVHSGDSSAKIVVAPFNWLVGLSPNGTLTNGRVHAELTASNGYVFTDVANPQWNTPCTDRPDSIAGWINYAPSGGDQGKVEVILHDDSQLGKLPATSYPMPHWVGRARYDITSSTSSSWVRFSVPFNYYNNTSPDYILMVITSGDSLIAVSGSTLYVDDFELIYNPNLVSVTPPASQNLNIGVDGTTLTVNATPNAAVVTAITQEWKFSTTSGSGYTSFGTAQTAATYTPNFATPGIYYVVCEVDFGTETIVSNEVEIVVIDPAVNTVTISPSSTQTILLNENGTLMTANETPSAASSREWKFSTTSGSGYISFGTPVTGTTYTPNFNSIGTFYVICESDFSGDVQISNEVIVHVPSAAGIDTENLKYKIYSNNQQIQIMLSDVQPNTYLTLYSIDGKKVLGQQITDVNSMIETNLSGVFVYTLVTGSQVITGKIHL
ncbi:MAG: PCMD domain-containing protein [Crocinitomicaceae bacterium]|nr:PCMD domain-containing protein [Crocinitomicaceae bacterium]